MNRSGESHTGFLGTYFNRDTALRIARTAGILAWALLAMYAYTTIVSIGQYWSLVLSGGVSFEDLTIFDRLSLPTMQLAQLTPGVVYFIMLKVAQQVLLILLDVEDNSRRAARK